VVEVARRFRDAGIGRRIIRTAGAVALVKDILVA
jgi:hypothetical protein